MEKRRSIGLSLFAIVFLSIFSFKVSADTIYLKNKDIIIGEVIKETDEIVTIKITMPSGSASLSVNKQDIDYIKKGEVKIEHKDTKEPQKETPISNTIKNQIRNAFGEYIVALKNYDVAKYKYLISNQSIKSGESQVKPFQMKNQYNQVYDNPYNIRISRDRKEALLIFKDSRNGTASPYIVIYEDNRWKVDLTQMWQRIRFGPGNRWYWANEWNK